MKSLLLMSAIAMSFTTAAFADDKVDDAVRQKVEASFPNTKVGSVNCSMPMDLCEVTAGKNVFYVSKDARFAMLGTVLDLKSRVNLTERRVAELASVQGAMERLADGGTQPRSAAAPSNGLAPKIQISLPLENAIVHHKGAPLKVAAFTDLNCHFCRQLFEEVGKAADIELTEYPMAFLSPTSGDKAKLVLCSADRDSAARAVYAGGETKVTGDCERADAAVKQNTAFGRQHGIEGTPTLVRSDGATMPGFMSVEKLREWLKSAAPAAAMP